MFQNHFKIALRSFRKNSSQGILNLAGLTLGLAICMLIAIFIANELSFDKYHPNAHRIWRVNRIFYNQDGTQQLHLGHLSPPFAPLLKNDFPDIEQATRLLQNGVAVRRGEARYVEDNLFFAEPNVFEVFDIPLVAGNPQTALAEPFSVLLSETTAKKYFGEEDPANQMLKADSGFDLKVTGVFEDFPYNSHWHPDMLVSFATLNDTLIYGAEQLRTNWSNNSFSTFLLLPENYPTERLLAQIPAFLDRHMT
ncbi:MAG: ABC transporter permease, partial [Bacteroidota bacterium]